MYTVWCEWDIGIEGKVFAERWVAERHARAALLECGIEVTWDELRAERLIGLDELEVFFE